jgi:hypothetical protein
MGNNKMTALVIFLNRWLDCPDRKRAYHDELQEKIAEAKAIFDMDTRFYTPFEKELSKQKSQHLCRDRIKIVKTTQDEQ